ncbi:alkaline phosphatase family protein [Microbulbifer sp. YPW16]|uniref:alkaline phosphatase family protein n=1 Tax=Microbulbifer sp. YPW16 TaxID=2904242 RepID=UPI001E34173F|nr:alkaline phosphatase family protein [Microbulbifer sp. YPW16]UHQ55247.1 alkaline phosphatase family protein [Microbulbifer sp. YPW16]
MCKSKVSLIIVILALAARVQAADNLVLVTIDGLRWQEVFSGYDPALMDNEQFTEHRELLLEQFGANTPESRRQKLMPFLWGTIARQGLLAGNRAKESRVEVANPWWFSYPGYNEILTGRADPEISSNRAVPNKNHTFLEWLHSRPAYRDRVAAFGSWEVFPAILNRDRSGIHVNAGFQDASWAGMSARARFLNELQASTPSPWTNVRLDAFTYGFAREFLQQRKPRVLYLALGETDDFAHDGDYYQYLNAAHRSDSFLADLWRTLQSIPAYKDNTNLVITVDHGRGRTPGAWPHHASRRAVLSYFDNLGEFRETGVEGASETWIAALGPDIRAAGELAGGVTLYLDQVAATSLLLLGENPEAFARTYSTEIGKPITRIIASDVQVSR